MDKKVSMPLDFYLFLSLLPFVSIPPPSILFSIFLILEVSEFSARKQLEPWRGGFVKTCRIDLNFAGQSFNTLRNLQASLSENLSDALMISCRGSSRPRDKGGGQSQTKLSLALWASVWSKNKGLLPCIRRCHDFHQIKRSFTISNLFQLSLSWVVCQRCHQQFLENLCLF